MIPTELQALAFKSYALASNANNGDMADASIMLVRTLAAKRGASPVEIQRNVLALDSDAYPIRVTRGPWK